MLHPASAEGSATYNVRVPGPAALGYVDGDTLALEARSGDGNPEGIPGVVADVAGRKFDTRIVVGPAAVKAAIAATRTILIVVSTSNPTPCRMAG